MALTTEELSEKIDAIDKQISIIKEQLIKLGPMRPGVLSRQYQKPKERKVPYWQVSYTHRQKSHSDYVRDSLYEPIREEVETYQQFTGMIQGWTDLSIERAQLSLKLMRMTAPRRTPTKQRREQ